MKRVKQALGGVGVLLLAGCVAGPDYRQPEMKLDAAFHNAPSLDNAKDGVEEPASEFWKAFNDPILNQLIEAALTENADVRVAMANLQAVRAQERGVDAEIWPTFGVNGGVSKSVMPQSQAPGDRASRTHTAYEGTLDMSWEANLFGRYSRAREMAAALTSAEEAGIHAAQVSVSAEVAAQYFQLRGLQAQLELAKETVQNVEALQDVTKTRYTFGRGAASEGIQVRALLESTRATVPELEGALQRTRYRIARLTGNTPTGLDSVLVAARPLPGLPVLKNVGSPELLLRRRPDIRQAERRLAAATANIGFKTADLFPSVSLTGFLGLNAGTLSRFTNSESFLYNLGASIAWTAFDFGRIRSRIEGSKAEAKASLALYEGTVLTALEETESALVTFSRTSQQTEHLFNAVKASEESARIVRLRFEAGSTDIMTVLEAERIRIADQTRLTQAQTASATSLVGVYKALGGGWTKPVVNEGKNS